MTETLSNTYLRMLIDSVLEKRLLKKQQIDEKLEQEV